MPIRPTAPRALKLAATIFTGAAVGAGVLQAAPGAAVDDLAPAAQTSQRSSGQTSTKAPPPEPGDPFSFRIGTLNILGSQHARGGTKRASALARAIRDRGVDLVGMQEVQDDQLAVLKDRRPGYRIWPGQSLGNQGVRLQIAWRKSMFSLVDTGSITTTFDHQQRPIPWVRLENRASGGQFYAIDVHNSPRDQERARDSATAEQIALINKLRDSGKPVFILGDTNEHREFVCRVAAKTGMVASNGASHARRCNTGTGPIKVDWVMGTGGRVDFSRHRVDYGDPIRYATDHAFVHARVQVAPKKRRG
ncbi:MAG: endonuclease/exonuclease/phosphatase family protein [Nocardioides sp.]